MSPVDPSSILARRPPPGLVSFLAGTVLVGVGAVGVALWGAAPPSLTTVGLWTVAALVGELMSFPTATQRAQINLTTTMHLAMVLLLPLPETLAALVLSRVAAKFVFQRQIWYRALFNVAQVTLAVLAAKVVYTALGSGSPVLLTPGGLLHQAPAFLASAAVYYAINTGAVSVAISLATGDSAWRAWRENYGYPAEAGATVALALMAPVVALCTTQLGWVGLTVVLIPMVFVRASSVRYISLRRAQQNLIASERLAAKGEIAAEVGHEINNYLTGVYGQVQLILLKGDRETPESVQQRLGSVLDQLNSINTLSKGLVDFTHTRTRISPTPVGTLVENTVAFLRPQNRFDGIRVGVELDSRVGEIPVDAGQIQQAVMNLLINAANALTEHRIASPRIDIWVRLHDMTRKLEIGVADNGPGVPSEYRTRVFEPGFTTRNEGHGFGLSTTHRIVQNHHGSVTVENRDGGGALFRILLPIPMRKSA